MLKIRHSKKLNFLFLIRKHNFNSLRIGEQFSGFKVYDISPFDQYELTLIQLQHVSGAKYVHINNKDQNNVFGVGFKTLPENDKGLPHILEHCVLCGSKRFPVNDPFMKMQNRSLNSYMNAMTAEDWTFYPFRTRSKKDYYNLMGIYLDAVFFPNLLPADFHREGWNVQFDKTQNKNLIGGVVFNEMKGAYSNYNRKLHNELERSLFPSTVYRFDSGGKPLAIPKLSYSELKEFHQRFYSPSNAFFYSYGDCDLKENAKFIEENALKFLSADKKSPPEIQSEPFRKETIKRTVQIPKETVIVDPKRQHKGVIGWLCNDRAEEQLSFDLKFLSELLLSGKQTKLYKELIESEIGLDFLPVTGFSSVKQNYFCIGLDGISKETEERFEEIIMNALTKAKEKSFDKEEIEAKLHLTELWDNFVSSNFGLNVGINLQEYITHGMNPKRLFETNLRLKSLRNSLSEDPNYFSTLIDRFLLDNKHRSLVISSPNDRYYHIADEEETEMTSKIELERVAEIKEIMKTPQKDDISLLPSIDKRDLSTETEKVVVNVTDIENGNEIEFSDSLGEKGKKIFSTVQPTNGLVHVTIAFDIRKCVPESLRPFIPFYLECLGDFTAGGLDPKTLNKTIEKYTGGISGAIRIVQNMNDCDIYEEHLTISTLSLERNIDKMVELLGKLVLEPSFEENEMNVAVETLTKMLSNSNGDLMNNGLTFASLLAASNQRPIYKTKEFYFGLTQIRFLNHLYKNLDKKDIQSKFIAISRCLSQIGIKKIFVCGTEKCVTKAKRAIRNGPKDFVSQEGKCPANERQNAILNKEKNGVLNGQSVQNLKSLIGLPIQSNYVVVCFPTVPFSHKDYPILLVLGRVLQWEFLHKFIREEGNAYGSGAVQQDGIFRIFSHNDPHSRKTLINIAKSIRWASYGEFDGNEAKIAKIDQETVDSAILSVFSALEKPISPSSKGKEVFYSGMTHSKRQQLRQEILDVSPKDILEVSKRYLLPHAAWIAGEMDDESYRNKIKPNHRAATAIAGMEKLREELKDWTQFKGVE